MATPTRPPIYSVGKKRYFLRPNANKFYNEAIANGCTREQALEAASSRVEIIPQPVPTFAQYGEWCDRILSLVKQSKTKREKQMVLSELMTYEDWLQSPSCPPARRACTCVTIGDEWRP